MTRAKREKRFARRGYHHGNLKEALVAAARQLILEKGPHGFSLIEAARLADVSPSAPYRHFADRRALLAEIARRGFERFAKELEQAWDGGAPEPVEALTRMGDAYVEFALSDRASYAAMFEAGLSSAENPELKAAAKRAHRALADVAEALDCRLPDGRPAPPELVFFHIWSLSHGAVTLFRNEPPGSAVRAAGLPELLETGISIYLNGLGISQTRE